MQIFTESVRELQQALAKRCEKMRKAGAKGIVTRVLKAAKINALKLRVKRK